MYAVIVNQTICGASKLMYDDIVESEAEARAMLSDSYYMSSFGDGELDWWLLDIGDLPYAVIKSVAHDCGGVTVECVGNAHTIEETRNLMHMVYEREKANPIFYAGWDDEYCFCDDDEAELSVETRDCIVHITYADTTNRFERPFGVNYFEHLS